MRKSNQNCERPVIINATSIGRRPSGIGIYTLNILKELSQIKSNFKFLIYLNKSCFEKIHNIEFPENFTLKWVTPLVSPDNLFRGHLLRLFYSNYLSLKHPKSLFIVTSQLEACFFRSKQVITVHDIIPLLFKKYHYKQYYFFKYLLNFALKKARRIITTSNHTKTLIQTYYNINEERIQVIPNGVRRLNKIISTSSQKNIENYILYIGRLSPMKNVVSLIKAFNLLRDKIPHKLIICGEGKKYLDNAIRREDLTKSEFENDRIVIMGYMPDEIIYNLYKNASLFIFPSFAEGFGLPPLESMNCGCPTVVSHVDSIPEVCGDAAYYVDPYDINNIAEGIYHVLGDKRLRENLISKGYKRCAIFSWQKSAEAHLQIINETVGAHIEKVPNFSNPSYSLAHLLNNVEVDSLNNSFIEVSE